MISWANPPKKSNYLDLKEILKLPKAISGSQANSAGCKWHWDQSRE